MKITMAEWAKRSFSPAPCRNTLCKWRKLGMISPAPVFLGKAYYVEENARYVGGEVSAPRRPDIAEMHSQKRKKLSGKSRLIDRI